MINYFPKKKKNNFHFSFNIIFDIAYKEENNVEISIEARKKEKKNLKYTYLSIVVNYKIT